MMIAHFNSGFEDATSDYVGGGVQVFIDSIISKEWISRTGVFP